MMKRRNYLICSIIAMLSIVSYACETEYAICEGCGISGGDQNQNQNGNVNTGNTGNTGGSGEDSNSPSGGENAGGSGEDGNNLSGGENAGNNGEGNPGTEDQTPDPMMCEKNNTYRCDENLLQHCENGQWKSLEKESICKDDETVNKCVNGILNINKCIYSKVCVEGECREKSTCTKDGYVCKDGVLYECAEGDQNVKQVSIKAACEIGKVVWCDKNKSGEPNKTDCAEIDSKVKICVGSKLTLADKKFCECCNNGECGICKDGTR